jgi:hypothetical protein
VPGPTARNQLFLNGDMSFHRRRSSDLLVSTIANSKRKTFSQVVNSFPFMLLKLPRRRHSSSCQKMSWIYITNVIMLLCKTSYPGMHGNIWIWIAIMVLCKTGSKLLTVGKKKCSWCAGYVTGLN